MQIRNGLRRGRAHRITERDEAAEAQIRQLREVVIAGDASFGDAQHAQAGSAQLLGAAEQSVTARVVDVEFDAALAQLGDAADQALGCTLDREQRAFTRFAEHDLIAALELERQLAQTQPAAAAVEHRNAQTVCGAEQRRVGRIHPRARGALLGCGPQRGCQHQLLGVAVAAGRISGALGNGAELDAALGERAGLVEA